MHQVGHYLERNFIFSRSFPARPAAAEAEENVWGRGGEGAYSERTNTPRAKLKRKGQG